jgi:hypothetical protein
VIEVSAKIGDNVDLGFREIAENLIDAKEKKLSRDEAFKNGERLNGKIRKIKQGCCK